MAYQPKPNQFGLFLNERAPEKSDYTAQAEIQCPKCGSTSPYWVSGWRKVAKSGLKYISVALRPKGERHPGRTEPAPAAATQDADIEW